MHTYTHTHNSEYERQQLLEWFGATPEHPEPGPEGGRTVCVYVCVVCTCKLCVRALNRAIEVACWPMCYTPHKMCAKNVRTADPSFSPTGHRQTIAQTSKSTEARQHNENVCCNMLNALFFLCAGHRQTTARRTWFREHGNTPAPASLELVSPGNGSQQGVAQLSLGGAATYTISDNFPGQCDERLGA